MLAKVILIILILLLELFCGCSYVSNTEGSDLFYIDLIDLMDWAGQITMNMLILKQAILTNDSATFSNFFEKDVLIQNNVNFKEDVSLKNYKELKIQIHNVKTFFFTDKKAFGSITLASDSLLDLEIETVEKIRKELKEHKTESSFPLHIDAGDISETTIVYAKADLEFTLKAKDMKDEVFSTEKSEMQTFYLKKDKEGNWKIINFFVDSPEKNKIFNLQTQVNIQLYFPIDKRQM